jgi:prephenate dehydratase
MKVAIQGEPGSFSHEAASKIVPDAEIVHCALSVEAFAALAEGRVDAAVIPIENSLAGSVTEHFDLLLKHDLKIVSEMLLRIRHNLISVSGANITEIDRVFSHPIALAQCRKFIADHPRMQAFPFYDTAGSVKQIVTQRDRHSAAIASANAAQFYGAQILAANIEDNPENFTRFYLIHRAAEAISPADANKVSLAFALENRPGSLVSALSSIASLGANLTKIESRPVPGKPWEYIFYVDAQLINPNQDEQIVEALRPHCSMVKELGLYRESE